MRHVAQSATSEALARPKAPNPAPRRIQRHRHGDSKLRPAWFAAANRDPKRLVIRNSPTTGTPGSHYGAGRHGAGDPDVLEAYATVKR